MGVNQSDRQASIRAVTGTAWTYEGDWHALFDQAGIASGDYNGRLLAWINQSMGASYAELNGAMSAFAASQSAPSWNEMGTFTPGSAPVAAWDASTSTLAQLAVLATHTRTSLATMFDSTGKLTYAPNNLLLNSATLSTQTVTVQSGVSYILSIKGTGSVTLTGASTAGPLNGTGAGNRVDLKITAATSSLTLTVSGSVTSARLSAVTYETAFRSGDDVDTTSSAYYGPRFDYTYNGSSWVPAGLLIEPLAATNYCPYSSALSSWTAGGATLTNNTGATLDPSGLNTASILNPTGGTTASAFSVNFSASASTEYTGSVFVKSNGSNFGGFGFYDVTNAVLYTAIFNLTTGANTFATAGVTARASENIGNGWWRVSAKWTSAGSTALIIPVIYSWSSGLGGDATVSDKLFFWGPQFEKNFEASSYIANPSTGTTTRAPDNVQFAGAAATALSSANFSAIVEGRIKTANATGVILIGGTFGAHLYSTSNTTARAYDGTRLQVYGDVTSGGPAWSAGSRAGVAASPAGTSLAMAGGTVSNYTNFATQSSGAGLGRFVSYAHPGTLWVKSFAIYNQRLSDATLQAKSVVGASY